MCSGSPSSCTSSWRGRGDPARRLPIGPRRWRVPAMAAWNSRARDRRTVGEELRSKTPAGQRAANGAGWHCRRLVGLRGSVIMRPVANANARDDWHGRVPPAMCSSATAPGEKSFGGSSDLKHGEYPGRWQRLPESRAGAQTSCRGGPIILSLTTPTLRLSKLCRRTARPRRANAENDSSRVGSRKQGSIRRKFREPNIQTQPTTNVA